MKFLENFILLQICASSIQIQQKTCNNLLTWLFDANSFSLKFFSSKYFWQLLHFFCFVLKRKKFWVQVNSFRLNSNHNFYFLLPAGSTAIEDTNEAFSKWFACLREIRILSLTPLDNTIALHLKSKWDLLSFLSKRFWEKFFLLLISARQKKRSNYLSAFPF